ncbi:MAG TPA: TonB-dependent receptor [Thermoanaerobaculia bacterium]|jgi:iron complex outermembrane receptor protein|nr:TonB-dependent receptor [Thermoanaerobaculia bacterium]
MKIKIHRGGIALSIALSALVALAGSVRLIAQDTTPPTVEETVQVTATRVPEDVESVPASITVVSGEELAARGITNLTGALALVAGVAIPPGGDGGPAGSVPEIWGLREFDAFLLVVDGVPAGGAFNPALVSLDLTNVDRIEVLRGAAPVMYGATSFVGVIQVLHRQPGSRKDGSGDYRLGIGNYSSGLAAVSLDLPALGNYRQSLTVNGERRGFKDDDTGFDRGHVLYRGRTQGAGGDFHVDFDGSVVNQSPASPHVREGRVLSSVTPLDANYNPGDAKIDEDRFQLIGGYDRTLANGRWSTTVSLTHTKKETIRGFLADLAGEGDDAEGFEQDLTLTDIYLDTHWEAKVGSALQIVAGLDHLYGKGKADSETFGYHVNIDGSGAESSNTVEHEMGFDSEDERNFTGLYANFDWNPAPRWHFLLGGRLNRTDEDIEAAEEELDPDAGEDEGEEEEGSDSRSTTRGSGMVGVNFLAWSQDNGDGLWLYADARDAFKPAALDFGPEAEADILEPETATSYEIGAKGHLLDGRLDFDISAFQMDFENLIISINEDGHPGLGNGGKQRFKGEEIEVRYRLFPDLRATATYARHSSKFVDFIQDFDGTLTQLAGKRLEMAPEKLASYGLVYSPKTGFNAYVIGNYTGDRFLNKRNTALAAAYSTWGAGLGFRFNRGELRLDGENLSDERDPLAESELGDAQYYRQPARSYLLSWQSRF